MLGHEALLSDYVHTCDMRILWLLVFVFCFYGLD